MYFSRDRHDSSNYNCSTNIVSFLSAHNTNGAPKRLRDARVFKKICNACLSFVMIESLSGDPQYIPFCRGGEPIETGAFGKEKDEKSGLYLDKRVARLDKGIPNPKERPVLPLPWSLSFRLTIFPNKEIKEQELKNLFVEGESRSPGHFPRRLRQVYGREVGVNPYVKFLHAHNLLPIWPPTNPGNVNFR